MINETMAGRMKGVSRAVITAVVTLIVAIIFFATTAFADMVSSYKVTVIVDDDKYVVTTSAKEPIDILKNSNIALKNTDKLDISHFTAGKGGIITVDRLKNFNVKFDGRVKSYNVYADTVGEASQELGLSLNSDSKMNYKLASKIREGMVVDVKSTPCVKIEADGKTFKVPVVSGTVGEAVKLANISLGTEDYTSPSKSTKLKKDMTIKINRVTYKKETVKKTISYSVTEKPDSSQYQGISQVVTKGKNGEAKITYKVKYVNGKKTSKKETSRVVTKKAVNEVVKVGTKKTSGYTDVKSNGVTSMNGYSVGQKIKGDYTHYCACGICGSGTGITASGKKVSNGMKNPYYIACNWLPMGSVVNIDGTNYTVVDRGGSGLSRTGRVDIFTPEGHNACFRYGRGSCDLTIIRLGW